MTSTIRDYRRIERAIGFLEGNYRRQPSLVEAAHAAGLSEFHARSIGRPRAARAVAGAVAANPVAYLIPCHRVIRKTGALGDYRWGGVRKQAMLVWEAAATTPFPRSEAPSPPRGYGSRAAAPPAGSAAEPQPLWSGR
ncbi:MAG: methylated-DNA--[protein]-cysteine S-methyltransferase [Gemmatimonadales bacterium]